VVLTRGIKKGIEDNNCIYFFFEYLEILESKSEHYKTTYGIQPEFKAGISSAFVTVAEVGELKKELAYHVDVLNTASRILGLYNKVDESLLISEQFAALLTFEPDYKQKSVGKIELKGKLTPTKIYGIAKSQST
jgi:adenylate cyclase